MNREVPRSRRAIATLLLVLMAGCQTWQPTAMSPRAVLSAEAPSSVRVMRNDGEIVTIKDPRMRNDSIVSGEDGVAQAANVYAMDIRSLEVRRFDGRKTILFAVGIVAVALAWTSAVTGSSGGMDIGDPPPPKGPTG